MGPPVAVYVVAAVVGFAAVYAFKEFVYEPHIAPRVEAWAEEFLERRRAARSRDPGAVPVSAARRRRRRRSRGSAASSGASHHSNDVQGDLGEGNGPPGPNTFLLDEFELEALASKEVDEWRNEVLRSQERNRNNLRRRHTDRFRDGLDSVDNTSTTFDESFTSLTHTPTAYVISNISSPATSGTVSLPQTPSRRPRTESQSTPTPGDANVIFMAPNSPPPTIHETSAIFPRTSSPVSAGATLQRPTGGSVHPDIACPSPLVIPGPIHHSSAAENAPRPLPFTPTYQIMGDDSPFGPLLPDTPRSSAEMYGERPFSPISRVMGSSSSRTYSRSNSMSSIRTVGGSGVLRKGSGLANEVAMGGSDDGSDGEHHPHASTSTFSLANPGSGANTSVISSLSERYPAPPTPPVIVSPPASSVGVISAPSSPRSSGSEVVIHKEAIAASPRSPPQPVSQTHPSLPLLQLPPDTPNSGRMSRAHSQARSAASPALSYASFLSPMPLSSATSEDEFLSVASDDSEWRASPVTPGGQAGPVLDRRNNPFLDFEHLTHGSEHGNGSDGSDGSGDSEEGSDDSWGSARQH